MDRFVAQASLRTLLTTHDLEHHMTLNTNSMTGRSPKSMKALFSAMLARIDAHYLGAKWSKKKPSERTLAFGFVEHLSSNAHLHVLLRLPKMILLKRRYSELDEVAAEHWKKLCPSGSTHCEAIYEIAPLAAYVTKCVGKDLDTMFLSGEFHHRKEADIGQDDKEWTWFAAKGLPRVRVSMSLIRPEPTSKYIERGKQICLTPTREERRAYKAEKRRRGHEEP